MVTGLDLGEATDSRRRWESRLPLRKEKSCFREATPSEMPPGVYAEDPDNNFFPSPGKILSRRAPPGPGIRFDDGVY